MVGCGGLHTRPCRPTAQGSQPRPLKPCGDRDSLWPNECRAEASGRMGCSPAGTSRSEEPAACPRAVGCATLVSITRLLLPPCDALVHRSSRYDGYLDSQGAWMAATRSPRPGSVSSLFTRPAERYAGRDQCAEDAAGGVLLSTDVYERLAETAPSLWEGHPRVSRAGYRVAELDDQAWRCARPRRVGRSACEDEPG